MTMRARNECRAAAARSPREHRVKIAPARSGSDTKDSGTRHRKAATSGNPRRLIAIFVCPKAVNKDVSGGEWHRAAILHDTGFRKRISCEIRAERSKAVRLPDGNAEGRRDAGQAGKAALVIRRERRGNLRGGAGHADGRAIFVQRSCDGRRSRGTCGWC
jgi:hypothetical protein